MFLSLVGLPFTFDGPFPEDPDEWSFRSGVVGPPDQT